MAAPQTSAPRATFTGNRALEIEEPLLFDIGRAETTGVGISKNGSSGPSRGWAINYWLSLLGSGW